MVSRRCRCRFIDAVAPRGARVRGRSAELTCRGEACPIDLILPRFSPRDLAMTHPAALAPPQRTTLWSRSAGATLRARLATSTPTLSQPTP
jgi:hypothetical protein